MVNHRLIAGLLVAAVLAVPAAAQDIRGEIESALVAQGYEILHVGRTWLGRLRVVAQNDELRREIVINPATGEVLRDYSISLARLNQPFFSDDDDDDDDDNRTTAAAPPAAGAENGAEATAADEGGAASMGAAGAVEAPPLAVDD